MEIKQGALAIKSIVTTVDQEVEILTGFKFSLKKWLRNIGRDELGYWDFGLSLGFVEVYDSSVLPASSSFKMLELAILDLNRYVILMDPNFGNKRRLRFRFGKPELKYIETEGSF